MIEMSQGWTEMLIPLVCNTILKIWENLFELMQVENVAKIISKFIYREFGSFGKRRWHEIIKPMLKSNKKI